MDKAYILHQNKYWTESLDFLFHDTEQFSIVASSYAVEGAEGAGRKYPLESMEKFDPKKHRLIISSGLIRDPIDNVKVVSRFLHSTGFFVYPLLKTYAGLVEDSPADFRLLLVEEYYKIAIMKDLNHEALDHYQSLLVHDSRVRPVKTNVYMCRMHAYPKTVPREKGTGIVCLTWLLVDNRFEDFLKIMTFLKSELKLSIVLHPLTRLDPEYLQKIRQMEPHFFEKVYFNLSRPQLAEVFDRHEYVISDGSGSIYEAMVRGCKPLAIRCMRSTPIIEPFVETLDEECFPFPNYTEIKNNPAFDSESFLRQFFPYIYQQDPLASEALAKKEVLDAIQELTSE